MEDLGVKEKEEWQNLGLYMAPFHPSRRSSSNQLGSIQPRNKAAAHSDVTQ